MRDALKIILTTSFKLLFLLYIPFTLLSNWLDFKLGNDDTILKLKSHGIYYFWFMIFVLGPLIETIIFQILIIKLIGFYSTNKNVAVVFSALLFSLSHIYSLPYFIYAFLAGLLFANLYFIAKNNNLSTFKIIFYTHALSNMAIYILHSIFFKHL